MFGRNPMFPQLPPRNFTHLPFPYRSPHLLPPRPGGIGGLIARLFSRGQTTSPSHFGMMMPPMYNSTNTMNLGSGLSNVLTNIQKTLGVVQQVAPLVHQYGPLVKNLPAMIKLFKELEPADNTESKKETSGEAVATTQLTSSPNEEAETKENNVRTNIPQPKLYI